ncbi:MULTISPECIES: SH3 domain-containing protein [Streptomyces]|uniref:SH3 domain-containing protein n=1 Tax=Streptomyces lycii TaxID=2654337 RepID=A0ABQ7FR93_9ACTN|nr:MULTISPECIES: SH3 domain-containing protein [Streptomyces]KAF4409853.1 SH3 domain-containing protein [Streptomyces lycii]PGH47968.1 SH3 domain-containing protein [Streptomyces sp. Ru87]
MLQSKFSKITLCAATGALAAATLAGPAAATERPEAQMAAAPVVTTEDARETQAATYDKRRYYKGRVISKIPLNVRSGPTRKARVIGSLNPGQHVRIECKVTSKDVVDGNPRWYKLADGKWAWAAARYIENIGKAPHKC